MRIDVHKLADEAQFNRFHALVLFWGVLILILDGYDLAVVGAAMPSIMKDMNVDASYCLVFDAARVEDGPVCKIQLPERISSGTHSTWAPGADLPRWRERDSAAAAIGL